MTTCVCGHEAAEHHAWTGACNGGCGCSFWQPDNGSEGGPVNARYQAYSGIYARKYQLDQETA